MYLKLLILLGALGFLPLPMAHAQGGDVLTGVTAVMPVHGTTMQIDSGYLEGERSLDTFLKNFYTQIEGERAPGQARTPQQRENIKRAKKRAPKLYVDAYVPAELPQAEKYAFIQQIERKFKKWRRVEVRLQEISRDYLNEKAAMHNASLRVAEGNLPAGAVDKRLVPTLAEENNKIPKNHERWTKGFTANKVFQVARIYPVVAGIGSATILITKAGWLSPLSVAISASLVLAEFAVTYSVNRWAVEFNNWKEGGWHIPGKKRFQWINWLNSNNVVKAAMFNLGVWGLAKPALYRQLLSMANPAVGGVSWTFMSQIAAAGAGNAVFGAIGYNGFRDLTKKGYLAAPVRKYMLWSLGASGIAAGGLLIAGITGPVPYIIGFNWGVQGLAFLSGKLLPSRANKASVYHAQFVAEGFDLELKTHAENSDATKIRDQLKRDKKGEIIVVKGTSISEMSDLITQQRAGRTLSTENRKKVREGLLRLFPNPSNCTLLNFKSSQGMPP